ncbi:tetratricopeptide repeat protein 4 [Dorcoceras hygrometricum]|uniref:Tetratricopeptide repeat protein 4 n=1 Tax=Dorcoceras hygrometricum TaxID=472368 RepID=A0A2Z7AQX1_9LAMI|nr:tetratricopeptide repeat protein 4 [Dorcoceras hygrometricum]
MALLMEAGSEPQTNDEIIDLEAISALKESAAIELKDKGNEYVKMGKKHYSDAIDCYTRAINQKALGDSEHSILYSNRAHVNLLLGNYRRALQDAEEAIKLSPRNVKALYRAAKASSFLNLLDKAKAYCENGLQQSPANEEFRKLLKQTDVKILEQESHEAGISKAVVTAENLVSSFEDRRLKMGRAIYQELTGIKKPMLDKSNMLHWPVVLLYPEVMSSDIIEDVCETDSTPPLPWDTGKEYTRDSLELYYEADSGVCLSKKEILRYLLEGTPASHLEDLYTEETSTVNHTSAANGNRPKWVRVDERKTLHEILKGPDFIIPGIPVFFAVSKRSSFYEDFKSGKWSLPEF